MLNGKLPRIVLKPVRIAIVSDQRHPEGAFRDREIFSHAIFPGVHFAHPGQEERVDCRQAHVFLFSRLRLTEQLHRRLPGPETGLFMIEEIVNNPSAVLCDALRHLRGRNLHGGEKCEYERRFHRVDWVLWWMGEFPSTRDRTEYGFSAEGDD